MCGEGGSLFGLLFSQKVRKTPERVTQFESALLRNLKFMIMILSIKVASYNSSRRLPFPEIEIVASFAQLVACQRITEHEQFNSIQYKHVRGNSNGSPFLVLVNNMLVENP